MRLIRYFLRRLRLLAPTIASTSDFGTATILRSKSLNFLMPFGAGVSLAMLTVLSLNPHVDLPGQLGKRFSFHSFPDAMAHKPRGFLGDTQSSPEFVATDPIFAIGHEPDTHEPLVQSERRILENGPDLERELLAASTHVAGMHSGPTGNLAALVAAAFREDDNAVRPLQLAHVIVAYFGVREVADGIQQRLGYFFDCHDFAFNGAAPRIIRSERNLPDAGENF